MRTGGWLTLTRRDLSSTSASSALILLVILFLLLIVLAVDFVDLPNFPGHLHGAPARSFARHDNWTRYARASTRGAIAHTRLGLPS